MKIIAFCGSKGSGKSTSGEILKDILFHSGGTYKEISYAQHLKDVCAEVFNLDISNFTDQKLKEKTLETLVILSKNHLEQIYEKFNVDQEKLGYIQNFKMFMNTGLYTPRKILQFIGTEVLHKIDPLIHVKYAVSNLDENSVNIITDLRFVHEFDYMVSEFSDQFLPVYIKNDSAEMIAESDAHPSEREFRKFCGKCIEIQNNTMVLSNLRSEIHTKVYKDFICQKY